MAESDGKTEAPALDPALGEAARGDPDLAGLRSDPRFAALLPAA